MPKDSLKWKSVYFSELDEIIAIISMFFIGKNTGQYQDVFSKFSKEMSELKTLARREILQMQFYYCVYPKIKELVFYDPYEC